MFWEPLGAAVPASLFQRGNCSSSSQSRSYPFIQFCSCYNSCNENFLPTQRESLNSKRHVKERKAFYLQHTAVCHLHNRSAVGNNCKHQGFTILSLGFWTFPAPSTLSLPLFFSSKWERKGEGGEYPKPCKINQETWRRKKKPGNLNWGSLPKMG